MAGTDQTRCDPALVSVKGVVRRNTGTSIWIDPDLGIYVLVLTNRTHPVRHSKTSEQGRQEYLARGRIDDAALQALGY
jgi:CubicO group peptidase (beta-lactamase class C family)